MSKKITLNEDKYHNTDLSLAIENGDFAKVRDLFGITEQMRDAEVLKLIGIQAHRDELVNKFELSKEAEQRVYFEAKDRLDLMGEDLSDLYED